MVEVGNGVIVGRNRWQDLIVIFLLKGFGDLHRLFYVLKTFVLLINGI